MTGIQLLPGWGIHTPNDGSAIGGVQPALYGFWRGAPLAGTQAVLQVEGPSYATVEAYFAAPQIAGNALQLSFDATFDAASLKALMLFETDVKRVHGTLADNHSVQRRFDLGNVLEVAKADGSWVSSRIVAPAFVPGVPMRHIFDYARDPVKLTYETQLAAFGHGPLPDVAYAFPVPPELQGLAPAATGWPAQEAELIQFQITLGPLPAGQTVGRAFVLIDNVCLVGS